MMKQAAIYARVSDPADRGNFIERQIEECKEYLKDQGIDLYDIFIDKGISNGVEDRESYAKLMNDAESKKFDTIIVSSIDRMARSNGLLLLVKVRLKRLGVELIDVRGPKVEDDVSQSIYEAMTGFL